jgi:prolyl-tRNA synthetase
VRLSKSFIPTLKEIPSEAVAKSHRLMLRAGFIRGLSAGVYSYLPFFWRSLKKVAEIIRQEMDAVGAQELYLPALNPVEVWEESGRHAGFGPEKFNFLDRKGHPMTLAPTHEEIICDLARKEIRSYRELPQVWYQIQTKFRDEPRPRSGVLRSRQFIMKDAYSLDADWEGLDISYQAQKEAYKKIFTRCGLNFFIVGASTGLMGGRASEEFMLESAFGEDNCAICDSCAYSANVEVATSPVKYTFIKRGVTPKEVHTPGKKTIEEVSGFLNLSPENFLKAIFYIAGDEPVMALISGLDDLNEVKLSSAVGTTVRPAHLEEVLQHTGTPAGFIGPVGLKENVRLIADKTLCGTKGMVCGANKTDYHLLNVDLGVHTRAPEFADLRLVRAGNPCPHCGKPLRIATALELGHIFKLGTKYSDAMGAKFLDTNGKEQPIIMGSYGIGLERIVAANIEQWADENGLNWHGEIAPYTVVVLPLNSEDEKLANSAEMLYNELISQGFEAILDDRPVRAGVKFKDADLLGIPLQIIFGKHFEQGKLEIKVRTTNERIIIPSGEAIDVLRNR